MWILLRRNIRELKLNYYVRAASIGEFLKDLLEFMRRCQDELVEPAQYRAYVERIDRGELPVPRVGKSKKAKELTEEEARGRCHEIQFVFETVERMLRENNFGTASELRELLGTSRRVIIPFLERLDRDGVTRRVADKRVLAKPS